MVPLCYDLVLSYKHKFLHSVEVWNFYGDRSLEHVSLTKRAANGDSNSTCSAMIKATDGQYSSLSSNARGPSNPRLSSDLQPFASGEYTRRKDEMYAMNKVSRPHDR